MRRPFLTVSLFYAAYFAVPAIQLAFLPLWLKGRGYDVVLIAYAMALPWILRPFVGPLLSLEVDRRGGAGKVMALLLFLGAAGMGFVSFFDGPATLWVAGLSFLMWSTALPLGEAVALKLSRESGFAYSHARLWGSFSFVIVTLAAGFAIDLAGLGFTGFGLVSAMLLCAALALKLHEANPAQKLKLAWRDVGKLMGQRAYIFLVLAGALSNATHAAYYSFGSILWQDQGYTGWMIGLLWALGVIAEIMLFRYFPGEKWRAETLLVLGALAGLARWGLMAGAPPLYMTLGLQLLHAFTFGATHLGAIHGVERLSGALQATAQTIYSVVQGLAMAFGIFLAGQIYAQSGAGVYAIMAAFSAISLIFGLMAFRENEKRTQ